METSTRKPSLFCFTYGMFALNLFLLFDVRFHVESLTTSSSFFFSREQLVDKDPSLKLLKNQIDSRHSTTSTSASAYPNILILDGETMDRTSSSPHIIFPGGGIFFYYQAGLVNYLRENGYDLSNCSFSGASAGALTATLTATDVDFYSATDLALGMAAKAGVWDRTAGLQGIWGPMIEEWLDTLLPLSIDSIQDRVTLLVTPVPSFGKAKISQFFDRTDLIHCNMASVHLVSSIFRVCIILFSGAIVFSPLC
jgi:hypothetical protein